jgi:hypothetical protein
VGRKADRSPYFYVSAPAATETKCEDIPNWDWSQKSAKGAKESSHHFRVSMNVAAARALRVCGSSAKPDASESTSAREPGTTAAQVARSKRRNAS